MRSHPLVSVCIPSFNGGEFIATTLESIPSQTFADFAVVIADDKSTDRTIRISKDFKDPRIRLIENKQNLGLGRNWNKVLSSAQGEYVKLLGDDELLYPECLSREGAALEDPANAGARGFSRNSPCMIY
jgi:glycosyltransferase involved in cell wall biosynthesis